MRLSKLILGSIVFLATLTSAAETTPRIGARPDSTTFSTDLSNLWWNPLESGWGINIIQQSQTLFVTMFVYDSAGKPTWYVGSDVEYSSVDSLGGYIFTGTLYQTTGSYFGAPIFNPAQTVATPVGTITLRFASYTTGTLTYTVNGITVNKNIVPQTWLINNLSGNYVGSMVTAAGSTACLLPLVQPGGQLQFHITQSIANSNIQVTDPTGAQCTLTGTITQYGKLSDINGTYTCTGGGSGTFGLRRLEAGIDGISGAYFSFSPSCSTSVATLGAARGP